MVRHAVVVLCATCSLALSVPAAPPAAAAPAPAGQASPAPVDYRPPVGDPVVEPFRAPAHPYGAGHRGLGYHPEPGTPVRAAADGTVTFAGPVAGSLHVTVRHADGIRTTASFVASIEVVAGQRVRRGQVLATADEHLHFGARRGDAYFDPATLFGDQRPRVRLVPFEDPPGSGSPGERSAIHQLIGGAGRAAASAAGAVAGAATATVGRTVDWLRGDGLQLLRTVHHYLTRLGDLPVDPLARLRTLADLGAEIYAAVTRPCTSSGTAVSPPPERRAAVLVAGLGSSTGSAAIADIDAGALGYDAADVVRFSYAGGRVPTDGGVEPRVATAVAVRGYEAGDTLERVVAHGGRLADLLEAVVADAGGAPVDVLAHSQGGVVARLALQELEVRHGIGWLRRLGVVVTIGTPHRGADLATAAHAVDSTVAGSVALDGVRAALGLPLDASAPAVADLGETSPVMRHLRGSGVPDGVHVLSIAGRGDLVVPAPQTRLDGAAEAVVGIVGPNAHDDLPAHSTTTREILLALRGLPPRCVGIATALADWATGRAVSLVEDGMGMAALAASLAAVPMVRI